MIRNILDNTTELYMIKYTFGEIFSSRGETLCKNPSDQTVRTHQKVAKFVKNSFWVQFLTISILSYVVLKPKIEWA